MSNSLNEAKVKKKSKAKLIGLVLLLAPLLLVTAIKLGLFPGIFDWKYKMVFISAITIVMALGIDFLTGLTQLRGRIQINSRSDLRDYFLLHQFRERTTFICIWVFLFFTIELFLSERDFNEQSRFMIWFNVICLLIIAASYWWQIRYDRRSKKSESDNESK